MEKFCLTCGFADLKQRICRIKGLPIDPTTDYCTKHDDEPLHCETCSSLILKEAVVYTQDKNEQWHILCPSCAVQLNTCDTCRNAGQCLFESSTSPLPKLVQRQVRQGPMTTITQIKNPERIAITCEQGCPCYSTEIGCCREYNCCDRQKSIFD